MRPHIVFLFCAGAWALASCATSGGSAGFDAGATADDAAADAQFPESGTMDAGTLLPSSDATVGPCKSARLQCSSTTFNQVVDCSGNLVQTCSADKGCKDGRCVSACEAVATGQTSAGCEFYTHIPDTMPQFGGVPAPQYDGACFALVLVNSWLADLSVHVELGDKPIPSPNGFTDYTRIVKGSGSSVTYAPVDASGMIHPGDVAVVFLASGDPSAVVGNPYVANVFPCPAGITPAIVEPVAISGQLFNEVGPEWSHGTQIRKSFHVTTSLPATVADVYPFGAGASPLQIPGATLLLPVASWTKNYVTVDPAETYFNGVGADAWVSIVASAPDTHVTILSPVDIPPFGSVSGARAGVPFTYTLQKGQALEVAQGPEFAGAPIVSDQPIGVFGGHECLVLPSPSKQHAWRDFYAYGGVSCDAAHAQIPPIAEWGTRYVEAPLLRSPTDSMMVRLVGAVDGTTLTYQPGAPPGAPASLAKGQVADFSFGSAFVLQSQDTTHPFYASTIMTNCEVSGISGSACGDPEFVNAVPPEEFMSQYTVFADPSYGNAVLAIVEEKGASSYGDVMVDCLPGSHAIPSIFWNEIPGANVRYAAVPLRQSGVAVGACDAGAHVVSSTSPFGITVWGMDDHTSYAYVPAMGTKALTNAFVTATQ